MKRARRINIFFFIFASVLAVFYAFPFVLVLLNSVKTARQVRNRICAVLDFGHGRGWRSTEAPSGNNSLKAGRGLPRQIKPRGPSPKFHV